MEGAFYGIMVQILVLVSQRLVLVSQVEDQGIGARIVVGISWYILVHIYIPLSMLSLVVVELQGGQAGVQSTRLWPPPLTTSASFYLSPTLCPTNPPPPPGRIYDKIYLTNCKLYFFELQTVFGLTANCICPNFKIYLSKFPFPICQQLFATPSYLRQEEQMAKKSSLQPDIDRNYCFAVLIDFG